MREQFPSREVVGIDDLTMAQIALERFQNRATPFTPADESLCRIFGVVDKTANMLRYRESERRVNTDPMPEYYELPTIEHVINSLEAEGGLVSSENFDELKPSILTVLRYSETQSIDLNGAKAVAGIERLRLFLQNWERAECTQINEATRSQS